MKPIVRRLVNILLILVPIVIVFLVAFSSTEELGSAWNALATLNPVWLVGALLCWFGYIFFDALGFHFFLKGQKKPISLRSSIYTSIIGFYYSNITPGATGGQPMQVFTMKKYDVPVAVGTSAVTTKFICTQTAISLMALLLFQINHEFVYSQLGGVMWVVRIGWLINAAVIPLAILAAFRRSLITRIISFFIKVGVKLRMVKDPKVSLEKSMKTLDGFYACFRRLLRHPSSMVLQLFLAILEMLSLMAVTLCVYKAFGPQAVGDKNPDMLQLLTMACLLFVSASYTPLPGASGANEGGFLVYYNGLFSAGTIRMALLVWRFFTYYMFLLVGIVMSLLTPLIGRKKHKEEQKEREKHQSLARHAEEAIAEAEKAVAAEADHPGLAETDD